MGQLDGWSNWQVAFFRRYFFGGIETVYDFPTRIRYPRQGQANSITMLSGTSVHQPFWFGGDAPINLSKMNVDIDFQPDAEREYMHLASMSGRCSFSPQSFFCGIWIIDEWYIPAKNSGQTSWQTSRNLPYDLVDINDPTNDYLPRAFIDGVEQTIIQSGSPAAGEVKVLPDSETHAIVTPSDIEGTFLKFEYPPKMYICNIDSNEEIPDTDDFRISLTMQEHLITRDYTLTIP